tara:strand:+ start:1084 stop:2175 length:1092 start_codon:yes stop_codon:yes gene_type:complete
MHKIGFIGWRSLVGQVLLERLQQTQDLNDCYLTCYSTSQAGDPAPEIAHHPQLQDAYQIANLAQNDIIITTQGSAYTRTIHPKLRNIGWKGYWIDAASAKRLDQDSIISLDPINQSMVTQGLAEGIQNFIGGNCTVSLMLLALAGLVKKQLIKHVQVSSYQAISGAGSEAIETLIQTYNTLGQTTQTAKNICHAMDNIHQALPTQSLAYNLHPWIDTEASHGQTREEAKANLETNKIIPYPITVESTCVRIPSLRCHSQALTIELHKEISEQDLIDYLQKAHPWIEIVPNTQADTIQKLCPNYVQNQLKIAVGRIRSSPYKKNTYHLFTVGDQLLWGAAEPLRCTLKTIKNHIQTTKKETTTS